MNKGRLAFLPLSLLLIGGVIFLHNDIRAQQRPRLSGAICTANDTTDRLDDEPDGKWGHGHALNHDWYSQLRDSRGVSCCNGDADHGDCRPAQARQEGDGTWRVWLDGSWIPVPPQAVLDPHLNRDPLHAHICAHRETNYIYCFLPGAGGS